MRLLDRYLLRELLIPLGYCLCGFLIFWITFDLFQSLEEFHDKGMLARDIAEYYLVSAPEILVLLLPVALLLALLYALTNHARHQEITAIRNAGVSLWRLCVPYMAVGLVISLTSLAFNELWVPDSVEKAERIKLHRAPRKAGDPGPHEVRNLGFTNFRDNRIWKIGVYNSVTGEMRNPCVFFSGPDGTHWQLLATRAVRTNEVWTFYGASEFKSASENGSFLVPVLQTNVLAMPGFSETPEEIKSEIRISASISLGLDRKTKKADIPISEILDYLRLHPHPSRFDHCWLYTKLHGRLAAPWTCFVVVLIAVPFGAASGRRNVFVGVASSILICFSYFVLQQFGLALGTGGWLPPWLAAWFPNLTFGLAGLWMMARVR